MNEVNGNIPKKYVYDIGSQTTATTTYAQFAQLIRTALLNHTFTATKFFTAVLYVRKPSTGGMVLFRLTSRDDSGEYSLATEYTDANGNLEIEVYKLAGSVNYSGCEWYHATNTTQSTVSFRRYQTETLGARSAILVVTEYDNT